MEMTANHYAILAQSAMLGRWHRQVNAANRDSYGQGKFPNRPSETESTNKTFKGRGVLMRGTLGLPPIDQITNRFQATLALRNRCAAPSALPLISP